MPIDSKLPGRSPYSAEEEHVLRLRVKAELRKSMSRIRAFTPRDVRAASSQSITARVLELDAVKRAHAVALFRTIARRGEVETEGMHAALRGRGVRVAYPVLEELRPRADALGQDEGAPTDEPVPITACAMSFRFVDDLASFADRGRGFDEPPLDAEIARDLDVIVVPGLAFDPEGYRLGYGAGFYDRTLPEHPRAAKVGVAFEFQLLMEIPKTEHDVPVSWVVTEKRTLETGR